MVFIKSTTRIKADEPMKLNINFPNLFFFICCFLPMRTCEWCIYNYCTCYFYWVVVFIVTDITWVSNLAPPPPRHRYVSTISIEQFNLPDGKSQVRLGLNFFYRCKNLQDEHSTCSHERFYFLHIKHYYWSIGEKITCEYHILFYL